MRTLRDRLAQRWCHIWTGHHNLPVYEEGRWFLRCMHCDLESPGFALEPKPHYPDPISTQQLDEVYDHMLDVELMLHGGG